VNLKRSEEVINMDVWVVLEEIKAMLFEDM